MGGDGFQLPVAAPSKAESLLVGSHAELDIARFDLHSGASCALPRRGIPMSDDAWLSDPARDPELLSGFIGRLHAKRSASVLEMGTKRSNPEFSTMHRSWAAEDAAYVCTDLEMGMDVDVAVDAHELSNAFPSNNFDAVISVSVFEHLQRPWIVAHELAKVLKPGGELMVYTHFAFPIHGYPCDYFRFTKEGLETLCGDAGLEVLGSDYENPAYIDSMADPNTKFGQAYTGVKIVARKPMG